MKPWLSLVTAESAAAKLVVKKLLLMDAGWRALREETKMTSGNYSPY